MATVAAFPAPDKGFSSPDRVLSVAEDTFFVTEDGLSEAKDTSSVTEDGLSKPDKIAFDRSKGLFLSKIGVFDVPRPFLPVSKPVGVIQWLFLDR
ncbi:MAG: hypothetical protein WCV00_04260 [Verrucomicrobiia bacterium]